MADTADTPDTPDTDTSAAEPTRVVDGRTVPVAGAWQVDPSHSSVEFVVRHLMVAKVRGQFTDYDVDLVIGERPEDSTLNVTVQVASVSTRDEGRDGHLKSADFFDVETYPTLTFRSTKVEPTGSDSWAVTGDLTVRDVTRPVTLDVEFAGGTVDPWGNQRVGFSASAQVEREDFGLTWNQPLKNGGHLVGKTAKIEIEAEATRPQA